MLSARGLHGPTSCHIREVAILPIKENLVGHLLQYMSSAGRGFVGFIDGR
jgi:hypothetical protein